MSVTSPLELSAIPYPWVSCFLSCSSSEEHNQSWYISQTRLQAFFFSGPLGGGGGGDFKFRGVDSPPKLANPPFFPSKINKTLQARDKWLRSSVDPQTVHLINLPVPRGQKKNWPEMITDGVRGPAFPQDQIQMSPRTRCRCPPGHVDLGPDVPCQDKMSPHLVEDELSDTDFTTNYGYPTSSSKNHCCIYKSAHLYDPTSCSPSDQQSPSD